MSDDITLLRVYDALGGDVPLKGKAFLVDRLWPRGVRKGALDTRHTHALVLKEFIEGQRETSR
jgi:uncharacterized protein YeaO (DUF488 family)